MKDIYLYASPTIRSYIEIVHQTLYFLNVKYVLSENEISTPFWSSISPLRLMVLADGYQIRHLHASVKCLFGIEMSVQYQYYWVGYFIEKTAGCQVSFVQNHVSFKIIEIIAEMHL